MNPKFIFIQTYGCSANQNNSEILKGILASAGYQITNNEKIADILIINTCIVKGKTENKIKRRIQDLKKIYPKKPTIITGCMPETDKKAIQQLNPKALMLGTHNIKNIINLIQNQENYLNQRNEEKILLPKISNNKLISITQISEGCLGDCSYCKAKLAKGKLFSYSEEKIIKSIQNDLEQGAKEVWLTSQDCAAYNLDRGNSGLPELLNKILSLKHKFKLRLGMLNPNHILPILEELIQIYKNKKMYKFLHIPIQSADDKVLKDMNRNYKIEQAENIIRSFKKEIPYITIATDIIVGYPTETEQSHKNNLNFIKNFKPDVLNLSKFSSHKQTKAGLLKELPIQTINRKSTEIMNEHRQTAMENKHYLKDKIIKVFVNNKTAQGIYEARDENYNIVLIKSDDKSVLGKTIEVKIKQIGVHHMIGEISGGLFIN